jgi:hypothetical protein
MSRVQQPALVDDYGEAHYVCRYTGQLVPASKTWRVGAILQGVNAVYFAAHGTQHLHRASVQALNEADANCNTCLFFQREKHDKDSAGFLAGSCHRAPTAHPQMYRKQGHTFWVHPTDPMHMSCWHARQSKQAHSPTGEKQ